MLSLELGGKVFKKKLAMSSEYVQWGSKSIRTDQINRVRWGLTKSHHYFDHVVLIGTDEQMFKILCDRDFAAIKFSSKYQQVVEELWNVAGKRLVLESLNRLSHDEKLVYDETIVDKQGVYLRRHKLLGTEPCFCKWKDIATIDKRGVFAGPEAEFLRIQSKKDPKVYQDLFYAWTDNVRILGVVLQVLLKDGA